MDASPEKYAPRSEADILDLILANPFAWVVGAGEGFSATPLPLRPRLDADGKLVALVGHFARSNPQVARLRADPRAALLFMGHHAYVSVSWLSDRTQAPTWNYSSVAFDCDLTFLETPEEIEALLRDLIDPLEAGRPNAWSLDDMGPRAERLARGVIGFIATIRSHRAVFKLGQDEGDETFPEILAGLRANGDEVMPAQMEAFGPHRPQMSSK